jgi:MFS transporter, PAT family, solute carrier family 33 (acetyl-CoA transportor), member 1
MSFTIFLALNSPEFCNAYLRSSSASSPYGMIEVGQYMQIWSVLYLGLTLWLLLFKKEKRFVPSADDDLSISGVYKMIWRVVRLPSMWLTDSHTGVAPHHGSVRQCACCADWH